MTDRDDRAATTVPLDGLECRDCAALVGDALRDQPGVTFVTIDPTLAQADVEFDPRVFTAEQVASFLRGLLKGRAVAPQHDASHAHAGGTASPSAGQEAAPAHKPGDDGAHDGHDHHDHAHGLAAHKEATHGNRRRLLAAVGVGLVVMVVEIIGGYVSGSLVLLSDAAHVFTDVSAIALAFFAASWALRPATAAKTYGYQRVEIVAAFVNALALAVLGAYFVVVAFQRFNAPPAVDGAVVTGIAAFGLVANIVMAAVLHRGSRTSVNVRSAYLHVLGDILGSVAALVAGIGILAFGWTWLDPAATLVVSALILVWTFKLLKETLHILLEGTPERMDTAALKADVLAVAGVTDVHDLHVWTLTTGVDSMSAHIRVAEPSAGPAVVRAVRHVIVPKYNLGHITIEVEGPDTECANCD